MFSPAINQPIYNKRGYCYENGFRQGLAVVVGVDITAKKSGTVIAPCRSSVTSSYKQCLKSHSNPRGSKVEVKMNELHCKRVVFRV